VRRASNADEALQLLERESAFDVVFSDVVMPGIGGIEFAREVQKKWPAVPVVLTSGYSHVLAAQVGHGFPLLQKPYSLEGLQEALARALDR
jgi:CheY-like chemotaxis protein